MTGRDFDADLDLDPSLAKWVALVGGIICAALFLSLPLLQLVTL